MKVKIQDQILDLLLDKYERSAFFRTGEAPTRRFMLRFYDNGSTDFPIYDIDASEKRDQINKVVQQLAAQGLIHYQWMRGEEDHILAKVWLEPESIDQAYEVTQRRPKNSLLEEILLDLLDLRDDLVIDWSIAYCEEMLQKIETTKKIPALIPTDRNERTDLFLVLGGLQREIGQEITARVFSIKYLGDSKTFEKTVRSRLLSILRRYLEHDDDTRDEELLRQVGIVRYPEQFEFRGALRFITTQAETNFAALSYGSSLSTADLSKGILKIDPKVTRILSIENRANYFDALENRQDPNEIIIYHGGQYSPSRKIFFQAVSAAMASSCVWVHWGDMDFGGFSMLARLRREVNSEIQPYRMDLTELISHKALSVITSADYAQRVQKLTERPELKDCRETLAFLAEHCLRLEQEALLLTEFGSNERV